MSAWLDCVTPLLDHTAANRAATTAETHTLNKVELQAAMAVICCIHPGLAHSLLAGAAKL